MNSKPKENEMFFKYIDTDKTKIKQYSDLYYMNREKLIPSDLVNNESIVICCGMRGDLCERGQSDIIELSAKAKHVIVVEPHDLNVKKIKKYLESNQIKNVSMINKAIWNNKTELEIHVNPKIGDNKVKKIKTTTINRVAKDLEKVDLIHLTINGSELNAIHGARRIIKKHSPDISIAFLGKNKEMFTSRIEAIKTLEKAGYYIGFRLVKDLRKDKDIRNEKIENWNVEDCYGFAIATKDKEKLISLGFE
jgi:FkbM family methyltransferase